MSWEHFVQGATLVIGTGFCGFLWRLGNRMTTMEAALEFLMTNGIIKQQRYMDERLSNLEGRFDAQTSRP